MNISESKPRRLRQRLASPGLIRSLGIHDAFTARVVEDAGLDLVFLGGFGAAASMLGLPDVGLMTLTEMADAIRRIAPRLRIPLIADGDTGHGDLHNVVRTVREFEQAGAAGILLEDQVAPKRCGHFEGKQVVPVDEMLRKLEVARAACVDPDFVLIARTDARAVEGFEAAAERLRRYLSVGADLGFLEAPRSKEELTRIPQEIPGHHLANMLTGGATPLLGAQELEHLGFKIAVCPIETLLVTAAAVRNLARTLLEKGRVDGGETPMISFGEVKNLLDLEGILNLTPKKEPSGDPRGGSLH